MVDKIVVAGGRATGVRLTTREEIAAGRLVVSATDPGQLVGRLLGADVGGAAIAGKIDRYEWGDATMVIFAALDGPVEYAAGEALGQAAHVHLTPSLDALARMAVECRDGQLPATPLIVAWNDSAIDPSRVPAGKHLKKFVVLSVPYEITGDATGRITGRDWDQVKEAYADYLFDLMADHYLPELKSRLLKRVVHSPRDLERTLPSAVRGTISHGSLVPYQMGGLRPIPELGHYRTPVANVYACDSGNHPGPGVSMGPGRNAAQVICGDLGIAFPAAGSRP